MSAEATGSSQTKKGYIPKILVITTTSSSYPGADNAGQRHLHYTDYAYVIRVPDPAMFPPEFYIRTFEKGFDGIIIASGGTDAPFKNIYEKLSKIVDKTYVLMKEKGIPYNRLKLTAICTVCADAFVKEVQQMYEIAKEGPAIKKKS